MNQRPEIATEARAMSYNCPVCNKQCISTGWGRTLIGYYSPPGHNHDDNCRSFYFDCSCGSRFSVRPVEDCSVCGILYVYCSNCGNEIKF